MADAFRPLAGIRVLDFTRALAGPYCTMLLADLGAEVTKVEPHTGDETRAWAPPYVTAGDRTYSSYFIGVNRNKRSIALDLKHPRAIEIASRLAQRADVLIENFRPGVMSDLGLSSEALKQANPRLIWCSLSAFGQSGPWSQWKGYDLIVQAVSGLMDLTGAPDGPPTKVGVALADLAGGLHAAVAILAAILERQRTGIGRVLDLALLDCGLALMCMYAPGALSGYRFTRIGNAHAQIVPYQEFATADQPIVVAATNESLWRKLCNVLEVPDLASTYAGNGDRCQRRDELVPKLAARLATKPASEWLARFAEQGIPAAPVWSLGDALSAEHVAQRGMLQEIQGLRLVANPITRSSSTSSPPPELGEHGREVLAEVGYGDHEIEQMVDQGVLKSEEGEP